MTDVDGKRPTDTSVFVGRGVVGPQQGLAMGYVVWEGASRLNGAPIVVVATGVETPSHNPKTGVMVQTWILAATTPPHDAVRSGADASVCGGCPLRGQLGQQRTCYVKLHQAPLTIWRQWQAGAYRTATDLATIGQHRAVRLGAYGDPAAVPITVWDTLLSRASGWTGYSHQWRSPRFRDVMRYCMASCETEADVVDAMTLGFGTFRALPPHAPSLPMETACPAGAGVQCVSCQRCNGRAVHITTEVHGNGAKWFPARTFLQPEKHFTVSSGNFQAHTGPAVG